MALRQELIRQGITPHRVYDENVKGLVQKVQDSIDAIEMLVERFGSKDKGVMVTTLRRELAKANELVNTAYPQQ